MRRLSLLFAMAAISVFSIGCDDGATAGGSGSAQDDHGHSHEGEHGHDHSENSHASGSHAGHGHTELGPNNGHIIDLGRAHEYHAELLEDFDSNTITVFMHDGALKPMKIAQEKITLVLTAGEKASSFELSAIEAGEGSAFRSDDASVMKMIESGTVNGKLRVTIEDKPFSGTFVHEPHGQSSHGQSGHQHGEHGHAEGMGHDHDGGHAKDHDDHAGHDHDKGRDEHAGHGPDEGHGKDHDKGRHDGHDHEGDDKDGK